MPMVSALASRRRAPGVSIWSRRTARSAAAAPISTKARKPSAETGVRMFPVPGDHVVSAAERGQGHDPNQLEVRGPGGCQAASEQGGVAALGVPHHRPAPADGWIESAGSEQDVDDPACFGGSH